MPTLASSLNATPLSAKSLPTARGLRLVALLAAAVSAAHAQETVVLTDSFTRSDSADIGNGWVERSPTLWSIASNAVATAGGGTDTLANQVYRPLSEAALDQSISAVVRYAAVATTNQSVQIRVRMSTPTGSTSTMYYLNQIGGSTTKFFLGRANAGVFSRLGIVYLSKALVAGGVYRIRLAAIGTTVVAVSASIEQLVSGVYQLRGGLTVNDASTSRLTTAGVAAFTGSGSGYTIDDVVVSRLTAPPRVLFDDFARADNAAIGNNWIERTPAIFSLAAGRVATVGSTSALESLTYRPSSEAALERAASVAVQYATVGSGQTAQVRVRVANPSAAQVSCYVIHQATGSASTFHVARVANGVYRSLRTLSLIQALVAGGNYRLSLATSGTTPVKLVGSVERINSDGSRWLLGLAQLDDTDASRIVLPGVVGISGGGSGYTFDDVEILDLGTVQPPTVPTVTISGRVVDAQGRAWPLTVQAVNSAGQVIAQAAGSVTDALNDTDNPVFQLQVPGNATYTVRVAPDSAIATSTTATSTGGAVGDLRVTWQVAATATPTPIDQWQTILADNRQVTYNADGTIATAVDGLGQPLLSPDLSPAMGPAATTGTMLLPQLAVTETRPVLRGRVIDSRGFPVAGAVVRVSGTQARSLWSPESSGMPPSAMISGATFVMTDSTGQYVLHGNAGSYTVSVLGNADWNYQPSSRSLTLGTANVTVGDFTLNSVKDE